MAFRKSDWHFIVMVLCFIYGGASLLFFIMQMDLLHAGPPRNALVINISGNVSGFPPGLNDTRRALFSSGISDIVMSTSLAGSIISIAAGLSLLSLIRKRERKELTKGVIDTLTTPEEKLVIRILNENHGELTQSELVKRSRLTKVKVHRIVKRLESLRIVEKYSYGLTNKIKLNDSVFEKPAASG